MKIKYLLVFIIFSVSLVFIVSGYFIISGLYLGQVTDLERSRAEDKIHSTRILLENETNNLVNTTGDWSLWDDTYDFLNGENPSYITDNLEDNSLETIRVDALVLYDLKKGMFYSKSLAGDLDFTRDPAVVSTLTAGTDVNSASAGFVNEAGKVWIVASRPVTSSLMDMPVNGHLVFIRAVDAGMLQNISRVVDAPIFIAASTASSDETPSFSFDEKSIRIEAPIKDIMGRPALSILIQDNRDVYYHSVRAFNNINLIYLICSVLTTLLVYHLIHIYFSRPIMKMSRHLAAIQIGREKELRKLNMKGRNEISFIGNEIDRLLDRVSAGMEEEKKKQETMLFMSYHDVLTGLYNRRFFEEEYERLDTQRQYPLSILLGDVNGLKLINDTFGHLEGDNVIRGVARVIQECCRAEDIIARWGGDEYIILLPRTGESAAIEIGERIRRACAEADYSGIRITISLGCATKTDAGFALDRLIRSAERLMYERKMLDSHSSKSAIIQSVLQTLQLRSQDSQEHASRLKDLGAVIADAMGLGAQQRKQLELLAVLHDVGKIAISDATLNKSTPLDENEWKEMRKHPEIGYRILQSFPELAGISEFVLLHHERWDGTGYPRGLSGEQVPLLSRIVSVIDAFDAMTHDRPYRKAMSVEEALAEIARNAGTQFDPRIVSRLLEVRGLLLEPFPV